MQLRRLQPPEWAVEIAYNDLQDIHDYWFIGHNGETIWGTNTPNELMARQWLGMKHLHLSQEQIDEIVEKAKQK